ncbi:MAG: hypothetical protein ACOCZU_00540 [Planctomycetota bacterium]
MRTRTLAVIALLGLMAIATTGCGPKEASSPKEAAKLMAEAMEEGNKDQYLAQFEATEDQKKLLGAQFDMTQAMLEFHKKMKDAYGDEFKGDMEFGFDQFEKAEVKTDGDTATLTVPGQGGEMNLVKKDGAWKIDVGGEIGENPEKGIKMIKAQIEAYESVMEDIGKEGETVDSISKKLKEARMKAMGMGDMPEPDMNRLPE